MEKAIKQETTQKRKRSFRLPSAFVILLSIIIVLAILTWLIPAGQYEYVEEGGVTKPIAGTFHYVDQNPQGVIDVILAPISGFIDGIEVITFILVIGGFLGVVMRTGAINKGIARLIIKLNGKEKWLIPILMLFFAVGGSTYGMSEETLPFYPLLIPAFISAGYTATTAVSVILLGAGLGVIASTVNPFSTGIASGFAGISLGDGIMLRLIIFIALVGFGIWFIMRYSEKTRNTKLEVQNLKNSDTAPLTKKEILVLSLFGFSFLLMIYAVIPFNDIGISFLPTWGWWFAELSAWFFFMSVLIGVVYRMKETEIGESFVRGAADMLGVVFIIGISRGITIIMNDGMITDTILHYGEMLLTGTGSYIFIALSYIFYLPLSFLIPSTSGLATLSMPILAPMADFAGISRALMVTIFQSSCGIINLITPTSAVVMGALAFGKIPYQNWLKFIWKFVLGIFLLIGLLMIISALF
ncbi:MAG: YfcC family protein [Bacillota bacterium]|jgi:uncharacterized ion transporter superfamily protein YfcC